MDSEKSGHNVGSTSKGEVARFEEIWVPRAEATGVLRQRGLGSFG